jgi:hypothetical protein
MLWKLIIKVLKVFLLFCLLWGSLVVRFGDDVAKGSPMQESLSGNYSTSLYRIVLLIIAGIETNPGPRPPKYPCGTCSKACKWGEKALA